MAKKFDAKAKAKRQKILLGVLVVVFIGVLAWQVPSLLATMNKKPAAAAAPPPAAPAPTAAAPTVPGTPVAAAPAGQLTDSDPSTQAAEGQLVSFDRFSTKDPFAQQIAQPCSSDPTGTQQRCPTSTPEAESAEPKPDAATKPPKQDADPPPPPAAAPSSARISVNGTVEVVAVGQTFPSADPLFVLSSVRANAAEIAISGGSLDNGGATVTLRKGKKLTLENTVDGARYVLVFLGTS